MKKILYGISGIGGGHVNREIPIIEKICKKNKLVIFAYERSYEGIENYFKGNKNINLIRIAVPFWTGSNTGLDFQAMITQPENQQVDFLKITCEAMAMAQKLIGNPDLVITDYEPISAQYAYAYNAPLVTIDQQSKFLAGDFPKKLGGFTYQDEVTRLHMFFPKVAARVVCSFFDFKKIKGGDAIKVFAPTLKNSILNLKRKPAADKTDILMYISSAREFVQSSKAILNILTTVPQATFHIFVPPKEFNDYNLQKNNNIKVYQHGDKSFQEILGVCHGLIATTGHSLLSEAMFLKIPVYAIPVSPYEQHLNAYFINKYGFGISYPSLNKQKLLGFVSNLKKYESNIRRNKDKVLMKGVGQEKIVEFLEKFMQHASCNM